MKAWKFLGAPLMFMLLTGMPWCIASAAETVTEPVIAESGQHKTVEADVKVQNESNAVYALAEQEEGDKDASVKVDGDVDFTGKTEDWSPTAVVAEGYTGEASAEVTGDVKASSTNRVCGVGAYCGSNSTDGAAKVKVGGNISASSPEDACGVNVVNGDVTVNKDITVEGSMWPTGLYVCTEGGANPNANVTVNGSVSASGLGACGAVLDPYGCPSGDGIKLTVEKGVTANGNAVETDVDEIYPTSTGVLLYQYSVNGNTQVDINSDVTATREGGGEAKGIWIYGGNNVYREEKAESSSVQSGKSSIRVYGNVNSDDIGIHKEFTEPLPVVKSSTDGSNKADVLVTEVIDAKDVGVLFRKFNYDNGGYSPAEIRGESDSDSSYPDPKLNLTVWKINLNERGNVAEWETITTPQPKGSDQEVRSSDEEQSGHRRSLSSLLRGVEVSATKGDSAQEPEREVARDFEKSIMYIIKVEQPSEGGTIKAVDENGNELDKSFDFDIAYEGDKVVLKANLAEGYKLIAAYNGLGEKMPLLKDENGDYYIIVPKGGGVYLSVELQKDENNEHHNAKPDDNGKTIDNDSENENAKEESTGASVNRLNATNAAALKTGDNNQITPWLLLSVVSVGSVAGIEICNKKRSKKSI